MKKSELKKIILEEIIKETDDRQFRDYLGDGVYVFFNGYSFDISVNDHRNPPVVTFEPEVLDAFVNFKNRIYEKK